MQRVLGDQPNSISLLKDKVGLLTRILYHSADWIYLGIGWASMDTSSGRGVTPTMWAKCQGSVLFKKHPLIL